jgi:aerobic-type carbon monoxide dehydrogenase small subunit (CoxS/CutS family)
MQCKNHSFAPAVGRCSGCAEAFCGNCLVEVGGQRYCASCKTMALQGQAPMVDIATEPCPDAGQALAFAIVGLFICGIILEPIAISKAMSAKKMIAENPRLTGSGKATAAMVIAIIGLVVWAIALIAQLASH